MPNFVDDNTSLPYPKETLKTSDVTVSKKLRAEDWNALCQAAVDLRSAIQALSGGSLPDITDTENVSVAIDVPTTVSTTLGGAGQMFAAGDTSAGTGLRVYTDDGNTALAEANRMMTQWVGYNTVQSLGVTDGGTVNNLTVGDCCLQKAEPPGGGVTITGLARNAATNSVNVPMTIFNVGSGSITLKHENASSTDTNRFKLIGNTDVVIPVNGSVQVMRIDYPGVGFRWIVIGVNK